jgi:hypothetical protein
MISQSNGHSSTLVALGLNDSTSDSFLQSTLTTTANAITATATGLATTANTAIASGFGQSLVLRQ